jgi:hypothetical protein
MPAPNVDTGPSCLAAHIVEDDEVAESSKIEAAQPEQVAYRQQATKDLRPYRIEDGPK